MRIAEQSLPCGCRVWCEAPAGELHIEACSVSHERQLTDAAAAILAAEGVELTYVDPRLN